MSTHINLFVQGASPGATQPVEVEPSDAEGTFRILHSPGLVEGLAANDIVRVLDDQGRFEVLKRGGNLAIKLATPGPAAEMVAALTPRLEALGGCLDGEIERAAVWTVPFRPGVFTAIESLLDGALASLDGAGWWYGNVHAEDGQTPLGWWES